MFIPIILSTAREGRESEKVAKFVYKSVLELKLFETELIDVKQYLKNTTIAPWQKENQSNNYSEIIKKSHGVIIISPEYNHSFPGEFKIFFDSLFDEYEKKPVGFVGVSSGNLGGARAVEQLKLTALGAKLVPIYNSFYFPNVSELFDKDLIKENYSQEFKPRIAKFVEELFWFADTLGAARKNNN